MKKRSLMSSPRSILMLALALALPALAPFAVGSRGGEAGGEADALRVMSFNIRMRTIMDGRDYWPLRKAEVVGLIKRYDPDLIGFQEVKHSQLKDLEALLPAYSAFGAARDDGKNRGERCSIFYRTDRFELLAQDTFWLSETPSVPGSRSWDSACNRIVTWGRFRDQRTGVVFYLFNTHFDHRSEQARQESTRLLIEKAAALAGDSPVLIAGDFNAREDSVAYQRMTEVFLDAREVSETPPAGPLGTSRSFTPGTPPGARIDYVFVSRGVRVLSYAALDDTYGLDRRPSDHLPILVEVLVSEP